MRTKGHNSIKGRNASLRTHEASVATSSSKQKVSLISTLRLKGVLILTIGLSSIFK